MSDDHGPYRTLFENAPDGMAVVDAESGTICEVNHQFCELHGYARATLRDRDLETLTAADWASERTVLERLQQVSEDGEWIDWRNQRQDGSQFPVAMRVSAVTIDGQRRLLVRVLDYTAQADLHRELERKTRAMDEAPIGITISDPRQDDNPLVYVNDQFQRQTGYPEAEAVGRNCRFLQGPETAAEPVAEMREAIDAREPVAVELRNYRKDGTPFWNRVTIAPVRDESGDVVNFVGFQQDVTQRKTYERRLEEQRDNLELLNEVVRHDIRNDLQLVVAYAELLEDHVDQDGEEHLATVRESADTAIELTKTARDIAETMLQTDADREPMSLEAALQTQIDEIRSTYDDAAVTVDDAIPDVTVLANEMLDSVFRNVLKNAIQHNDADVPAVTVSVTTHDDRVVVRVADNGPGVPDDRKDEIFGKGEKGLDSEGTGIGLYLVNTLVDQYGGDVWVEDRSERSSAGHRTQAGDDEQQGAIFTIELETA